MAANQTTRRDFIIDTLSTSAILVPAVGLSSMLSSCAHLVPPDGSAHLFKVLRYIPLLSGLETITDTIAAIKKIVGDAIKTYNAGDTLSDKIAEWDGWITDTDKLIIQGMHEAGYPHKFWTPVFSIFHKANRFLQLTNAKPEYALVSGYMGKAYWIHHSWLEWLFNKDNCSLVVDGDAYSGECGLKGCKVWVNRQAFRMVDRNPKVLFVEDDPEWDKYPQAVRDVHIAHSPKWKNCPPSHAGITEACYQPENL